MTTSSKARVAATYERTSSEDQKERGTIRTQTDEIAAGLVPTLTSTSSSATWTTVSAAPSRWSNRPAGARLMRAAEAGLFNELWVYNIKRLGRDAVDLLWVRRRLEDSESAS